MRTTRVWRRALLAAAVQSALTGSMALAQLVNSEWNTGNGNWNVATSWFPNDVPDNVTPPPKPDPRVMRKR